jgi:hypothetical protein
MRTPSFSFAPMLLMVAAGASLAAVGCSGPPKVLVEHSYASSDKSVETYIQKAGASVGTGKDKTELFNVFMRVCNQDASNSMTVCKDTLILENVNPRSL